MTYSVKEIFYTLQGEGGQTGRAAVFCRFAGCNLWSGLERDRAGAVCNFCDTDFRGLDGVNGGRYSSAESLAKKVAQVWQAGASLTGVSPLVVCTGGEPLLQLDEPLVAAIKAQGMEIAVETNGTQLAPAGIDWVCVSPKAGARLVQKTGSELKLVYPQPLAMPERFTELAFTHFFLQPMDGPDLAENTRATVDYCLVHPQWRLCIQTHKIVGIE
ncbi:MAG: 7-carboxy-7-deazaguanine synthase [Pseudomonadales bacterium]|nr:7-carboxy-7-deazaguanine synthase [Pseudomonadales bacterium]